MWRKYALIGLALLVVSVDFVSSIMSIVADLTIVLAMAYVVWPILKDKTP